MTNAAQRMDRMYRVQRHFYDLTRAPYLLGRTQLIDNLEPKPGDTILEIGCGTAWNLVQAAHQYPETRLFGIDVSKVMLETAQRSLAAAKLKSRVTLAHGDATTFRGVDLFGRESFDRVFMSYSLSMIPDWTQVVQRAAEHVAPGGEVHIVDFGDFGGLPRFAGAGLRAWLDRFDVTPRLTLEQELRRLAMRYDWQLEYERLYGGYTQLVTIRRPM